MYLLKEAFLNVEKLGPHVLDGRYDLLGPDGSIILPQVCEDLIEPGWEITMKIWPTAALPPPPPPFPFPPLPCIGYSIPPSSTENDEDNVDDEYSTDRTLSWFWISQMNVIPGYWATPWASQFLPDSPFSFELCRGILVVMLQALLGFTNDRSLRYVHEYQPSNREWLKSDKSTFPPYARSARNGVVVGGTYEPIDFRVVQPTTKSESQLFQQPLPPIELLHSYEYQVNRNPEDDDTTVIEKQLELTSLDSWLSLPSRTPEISNGGFHLTRTTPALVARLIRSCGRDLQDFDGTASDGGLQDIQRMTDSIIETYLDEKMSKAELLFLVVAMIRTVKVAICIVLGPSTARIREELKSNIPVYLV